MTTASSRPPRRLKAAGHALANVELAESTGRGGCSVEGLGGFARG